MSTKYSEEFKASIIARLLPPNNVSVPELSRETGIPRDTLYMWQLKYRNAQGGTATNGQSLQYSSEEKLSIVIETASLSEIELGESGSGDGQRQSGLENCDIFLDNDRVRSEKLGSM